MQKSILILILVTLFCGKSFTQISQLPITSQGEAIIVIENPDIQPIYPGGQKSWLDFLQKNLNANVATNNKAPKGEYRVNVTFVVDTNGYVRNIISKSNFGYGIETEVIRILRLSFWKPAVQNNKSVNAIKTMSVVIVSEYGLNESKT